MDGLGFSLRRGGKGDSNGVLGAALVLLSALALQHRMC